MGPNIKILKHREDILPVSYSFFVFVIFLYYYFFVSPVWIIITMPFFVIVTFPTMCYNHHQQHHNVFVSARANRLFEIILGFITGLRPFGWILHHNLGHHKYYKNQRPHKDYDPSDWKDKNGKMMGPFAYAFDRMLAGNREIHRFGKKMPSFLIKKHNYALIIYCISAVAIYEKPLSGLLIFVLLPIVLIFCTFLETYFHHVGLESESDFESCYNQTGKFYNFISCNLGYHTAHHVNPSLHWSKLPKLHKKIESKIPQHCYIHSRWQFLREKMRQVRELRGK